MKRQLVNRMTQFAGWVKRRQKAPRFPYKPVKVNLGYGLTVAPDWINVDGSLNALIAT